MGGHGPFRGLDAPLALVTSLVHPKKLVNRSNYWTLITPQLLFQLAQFLLKQIFVALVRRRLELLQNPGSSQNQIFALTLSMLVCFRERMIVPVRLCSIGFFHLRFD
jgi:hypothetical protein